MKKKVVIDHSLPPVKLPEFFRMSVTELKELRDEVDQVLNIKPCFFCSKWGFCPDCAKKYGQES